MNNSFSLQKIVDAYLAGEQKEHDDTKCFYASQLGTCFRRRILQRLNSPHQPKTILDLRKFSIGKFIHIWLQDILAKSCYLLEEELKCGDTDYECFGRADALVQTPENGLLLYEFKSTHSRALIYNEMPRGYILQGLFYVQCLNKQYNNAIKQLRICQISRDDLLLKETGFYLTDQWQAELKAELEELKAWWGKREVELPPELPEGDWQCFRKNKTYPCEYMEN